MKVKSNGIEIHLEKDEIEDFWNIVMFAMDYHNKETKEGNYCMNTSELKLANELIEITEKLK